MFSWCDFFGPPLVTFEVPLGLFKPNYSTFESNQEQVIRKINKLRTLSNRTR